MWSRGRILAVASLVLAGLHCHSVAAQEKYPSRPITMIVPFPAGGGVDAVARIVADKLGAGLGQQIVLDNRGGAAGRIRLRHAPQAAPHRYTPTLAHTRTTSINPKPYPKPGY